MMNLLRRAFAALFRLTLGPVLALVLIFEEWGWEPLARLAALLARLPLWGRIERRIARFPPWAALVTFFVPMVLLLPVKLLALYWISRGHALLGVLVVLAAKMLGTAAVARLFALTRPALMQLGWFARLYGRWVPWKDALIASFKATAAWRSAAALASGLRGTLRRVLAALRRQ